MQEVENNEKLIQEIYKKYEALGQDPEVMLEGLKYSKLISYWDYIEVDTLLSLQKPRTTLPDEEVFIMYHQVTELVFKMILSEVNQLAADSALTADMFKMRVERINRYFKILISSFGVMRDGMDYRQYLQFRNTLTPASGFQSAQYRLIEITCTDLINLVDVRYREEMRNASFEDMFQKIYWQAAGIDHATGEKSPTLRMFEEKYLETFIEYAEEYKDKNLAAIYRNMPEEEQNKFLKSTLRSLDLKVNVDWPLVHYRTAERYLESDGEVTEATGGSDWKKYLHPKYQRRIFYPELWTEDELAHWGEGR